MKNRIAKSFSHCVQDGCIEISSNYTCFVDEVDGRSRFYSGDTQKLEYPFFTINNEEKKEIHLACVDSCLYKKQGDIKRCDFAVFNDNLFCFVEVKRALDPNLLEVQKSNAANQLRVSINNFKTRGIDFTGYKVQACICVGYTKNVPKVRTTNQSLAIEFEEDFGVELFEGNEIDL